MVPVKFLAKMSVNVHVTPSHKEVDEMYLVIFDPLDDAVLPQ